MGITKNIVGPLTSSNKTNSINMRLLLVSVFIASVALSAASPAWVERSFHAKRSETNERSFEDQPQEKSEESEEKEMRSADEEVMKKSHEPNPDVPSRDHGAKRGMGAPGMGLQRQMRASRGMGSMRDQRGFDEEQMMRRGFGMPNMRGMGMGGMGRGMSPDFNMKRGFGANRGAAANKRAMDGAPMKEEKKSFEDNDERSVSRPVPPTQGKDQEEKRGMFDMR